MSSPRLVFGESTVCRVCHGTGTLPRLELECNVCNGLGVAIMREGPPPAYRRGTQKAMILERLQAGGTDITEWPAGMRLASRIDEMRRDGYSIASTPRTLDNGSRIARYTLIAGPGRD